MSDKNDRNKFHEERKKLEREYDDVKKEEENLDEKERQEKFDKSNDNEDELDEESQNDESEDSENEESEDNESEDNEDEESEDNESEDNEDESKDDSSKDNEDNNDEENEQSNNDRDNKQQENPHNRESNSERYNDNSQEQSDNDGIEDKQQRKDLGPQKQEKDDEKTGGSGNKDESKSDGEKKSESSGKGNLKDKAVKKAGDKVMENSETAQNVAKATSVAQKGMAAAKTAYSAGSSVVQSLINPIFWVIVGLILIFITIISVFSIMGGNDYNEMCDDAGVGGTNIGEDADEFSRQSAIASWLMSTPFEAFGGEPMSREQAMGVMGNIMAESGGGDPKVIQGGYKNWETCDNDCVSNFVGGGKAVGIIQWDGNNGDIRRDQLVEFAKSEGTQWYDLDTQLKYLKVELDGTGKHKYENSQVKKGFADDGKSIEEYTKLWMEDIERCGKCHEDKRIEFAKAFDSKFSDSGVSGGVGVADNCSGNTSGFLDASGLAELAEQIAYTREERQSGKGLGNCGGNLNNCGKSFSKPEYIDAKELVEEETGKDALSGLMASCDRLVATMVRYTDIDKNYPYGNSDAQMAYMRNDPGWEKVSCQNKKPGDVFGRNGHIMIYAGEVQGKETVVSASLGERSATMSDISCSGDLFRGDGMNVPGYRKVE